MVNKSSSLTAQIEGYKKTIKFQLKKVLTMNLAIGHVELKKEELSKNVLQAMNFLVSLTKKGWNNIKSVYIKYTMSPSIRIF